MATKPATPENRIGNGVAATLPSADATPREPRPRKQSALTEARREFGRLLRQHLKSGTRPPGQFALNRLVWSQHDFAVGVLGNRVNGNVADRTVRNWCTGRTAPASLQSIENVLFGTQPGDLAADLYAEARAELRLAYQRAKGLADPPQTERPALAHSNCTDPGNCVGRDAEIVRLVEILRDSQGGAILVLGDAGHGKTTLTRTLAMRPEIVAHFAQRRCFVELERAEDAGVALAEIAQAAGLPRNIEWPILRECLERGPILLLLDNLETPLHAARQRPATEQLLRDLIAIPGLSLIASLRSQETVGAVPWTSEILLPPLPPASAKVMFLAIARAIDAADPDLDFFVGQDGVLGGIPLAIHLVAHRVVRNETLVPLQREWQKHGALLTSLPGGDGLRADSLLASIEFSLRSPRLKTSGHLLFALLGQLPAGLAEADADAIAGIDASDGAAQLRSVGLLRDLGGARIGLLPPIRDLALRRFRPTPAEQTAWIGYYLGLLEAASAGLGNADNKIAVKRLAPEMPNIAAAIQASPHTELGLAAVRPVLKSFENAVAYTGFAAEPTFYNLHAACVATGDLIGQGICLFNIGNHARLRTNNETATQALLQALDCLKDSTEFRTTGLCYWSLAEIATTSGNHPRAAECYALGQTCFQHGNWLPGEADCLSGLAGLADLHDEYAKATVLYEEASRLFHESNRLRSHADTLWYMGEMERVRENFPQATALFEQAMEIQKDLDYAVGISDTLRSLAHLAAMTCDFAAARQLLQRSRKDLPNITDYTLTNLLFVEAEIERLQGESQTAEPLYQSALEQFRSYEYLRGLADCEYGLGECDRLRGNATEAGSHYHAASAHYQKLGNLIGQAHCLAGLADLAAKTDAAAARQHGRKAIALYHRAGATRAAERRSKAGCVSVA